MISPAKNTQVSHLAELERLREAARRTRLAADRPDTAGHQPTPDHITT